MGENLSEAPKADGRGENLIEASLPSSKKREIEKRSLSENLSEVLKADGKGENLSEAPLLSFKKKEKKAMKKKKTNKASSQCGSACRLQVFYAGKEALNSRTGVPTI